MRIAALITAKSKSIRVPRKNFRMLCGKELYRWTTDFINENNDLFSCVGFSSDDPALFQIPSTFCPIQRTPELCPEETKHMDVIAHAIQYLRDCGETFDYLMLFQPTNPNRHRRYIMGAVSTLLEKLPAKMTSHYIDFNINREYIDGCMTDSRGGHFPPLIRSGNFYAFNCEFPTIMDPPHTDKFIIPKKLGYNINVEEDFGIVRSFMVSDRYEELHSS